MIIIGWSTWEREEWLHEDVYWQVNAGGVGHDWPDAIKERYVDYVTNLEPIKAENQAHADIHELHTELMDLEIPHLFFNTYSYFRQEHKEWHDSYIAPYDYDLTYYQWLLTNGCQPRRGYHFGVEAHRKWAEFLIPHLTPLL